MTRAVLISIRPGWTELIACGDKTLEIRKTRPNRGAKMDLEGEYAALQQLRILHPGYKGIAVLRRGCR